MIITKTIRDIRPIRRGGETKNNNKNSQLERTNFMIREVQSAKEQQIDRQLKSIFHSIGGNFTTSVHSLQAPYLKDQIHHFKKHLRLRTHYSQEYTSMPIRTTNLDSIVDGRKDPQVLDLHQTPGICKE